MSDVNLLKRKQKSDISDHTLLPLLPAGPWPHCNKNKTYQEQQQWQSQQQQLQQSCTASRFFHSFKKALFSFSLGQLMEQSTTLKACKQLAKQEATHKTGCLQALFWLIAFLRFCCNNMCKTGRIYRNAGKHDIFITNKLSNKLILQCW